MIQLLDIRTLFAVWAILCSVLTFNLSIFWFYNREEKGAGWWALAMLATTCGSFLLVFRGFLPSFISIVLASTLFILGWSLFCTGLRKFFHLKKGIVWEIAPVLVLIGSFLYYTYVRPDLTIRILIFSLLLCIASFRCFYLLLEKSETGLKMRSLSVGYPSLFLAIFFLIRTILAFFNIGIPQTQSILSPNPATAIMLFILIGGYVSLTIGLISLPGRQSRNKLHVTTLNLEKSNLKLQQSEESFRNLTDNAFEGIAVVQNKRLVYLNPRMCEMTGYDKDSLLNLESFLPLIAPEARETMMANHMKRLVGEAAPIRYESHFLKRDGTIYPIELTGVLITWNGRPATLNIVSDISERKAAEEKVRFMALHDNLTGLPNRYLLQERLERALSMARRTKQPLALLFMDLNGFKQVNDSHGHDVGDLLLKGVADRVQTLMRDSDTLARMGGDEFVILLPQVNGGSGVDILMSRIDESLRPPFQFGSLKVQSSASVGFALYPEHGNTEEELLSVADKKMYNVKHLKRKF